MAEDTQASKTKVFISYSRKDKDFVRKLHSGLLGSGIEAWVDWEGIPLSADWMAEITAAIEGADAFLFVISPDSLGSQVCGNELELGLNNNKKLVPILYRELEKGAPMPEKIGSTNWVYLRDQDDFDATLPKLVAAINTDLDWVRQHTRLLTRAVEWEHKRRDNSFLLHGSDLEEAERWMADASAEADRQIVPLQAQYISASRQAAVRRQRTLLAGVSVALVVSVFLAIFALIQRQAAIISEQRAVDNAATAVANEHARATQQSIAEANRVLAEANAATAVANEDARATQQAIAEANENARATQQSIAEANELKAVENEEIAVKERSIAQAQRGVALAQSLEQNPEDLYVSTLIVMDAMLRLPLPEAEELLRDNLSLLPPVIARTRQEGWINTVRYSPDGSQYATGSDDGTACVWKGATGARLYCLEHPAEVYSLAYTPDSQMLITSDLSGGVYLWHAADGSPISSYIRNSAIWSLEVEPSGRWLAAGRKDGAIIILDLITGHEATVLTNDSTVYDLEFDPLGRWLAAGVASGSSRLWRFLSGSSISGQSHAADIYRIAFSPDGTWLATASADETARLTQPFGNSTAFFTMPHEDWVEDLAFSPDSTMLATASDDQRVRVWDVRTGTELLRMSQGDWVQAVVYSPNGRWIASSGADNTARIWDALSGAEMARLPLNGRGTALAFSPDGQHLVATNAEGDGYLYDLSWLEARITEIKFKEFVTQVLADPAGANLYTFTYNGPVHRWDLETLLAGSQIASRVTSAGSQAIMSYAAASMVTSQDGKWLAVKGGDRSPHSLAVIQVDNLRTFYPAVAQPDRATFSPDGRWLAISSQGTGESAGVYVWDVEAAELSNQITFEETASGLAYSPDGKWLAVGFSNQITILDASQYTELGKIGSLGHRDPLRNLAFSLDGQWLAASGADENVHLWNVGAGLPQETTYVLSLDSQVLFIAFSPDGQWLATGSEDGLARLWDLSTGGEVSRVRHQYKVTSVSFSADSRLLFTTSGDLLTIWDIQVLPMVSSEELISYACKHLPRNLTAYEWVQYFGDEPYMPICPDLP